MSAPYRDELAALEARYAALEDEVADRERARDEAARMLAEAKARARNEEITADLLSGGPERRRQRRLLIAAAVAISAMGIGAVYRAKRKPSHEQRAEAMLVRFDAFADQLCACVDKACADKVQDDMTKWAQDMARQSDDYRDIDKASPDFTQRMTKASERYVKCYTKVALPSEAPQQFDVER